VSDTPRTDRARLDEHDPAVAVASECSKLERELNAANERIKRLEEELERTKQDRNAIAKTTREPLLLKLDHAAERIKRLEEALGCVVVSCNYLHHRKKHQHRSGEPCPVEELIRKAKEAKP
jgi:hypothetical protein